MKTDMKIFTAALLVAMLAVTMFAITPVYAGQGNGLPSGKHYTLNILGKKWDKGNHATEPPMNPDGSDNPDYNPVTKSDNGHRIFVKLGSNDEVKKTRIMLVEDTESPYEFCVLDADGTDGKAAFQLPDPGAVCDPYPGTTNYDETAQAYKIFIKVLYPKGKANMTTGVWTDPTDGSAWIASEETLYLNQDVPEGKQGKSIRKGQQFEDVTKELTTILADFDGDPTTLPTRIQIFDDEFEYYFWDYDNMGLKHVQLRFYPTALFPE